MLPAAGSVSAPRPSSCGACCSWSEGLLEANGGALVACSLKAKSCKLCIWVQATVSSTIKKQSHDKNNLAAAQDPVRLCALLHDQQQTPHRLDDGGLVESTALAVGASLKEGDEPTRESLSLATDILKTGCRMLAEACARQHLSH